MATYHVFQVITEIFRFWLIVKFIDLISSIINKKKASAYNLIL